MDERSGISAYPVGALMDWLAWRSLPRIARMAWRMYRHGGRRALRNYFNGYLAEWHYPPEGVNHYRCGRGWTKRAAIRRLGVHLAESNLRPERVS